MTLQERRQLAKQRLANPALYVKEAAVKISERADNQADKMIDRGLIAWWYHGNSLHPPHRFCLRCCL